MTSGLYGNVLVTGASGFIGSAIVRRLADSGIPVIATARRCTELLSEQLGVRVLNLDLMDEIPSLDGIHTLIHCATPNDIMSREDDRGIPLAVMGTRRILEHSARQGVKRMVFLSTLQVYGTELVGEIDEETPPRCETYYGLNHYLGEEVCRYFSNVTGMHVVALRPSNVFGLPTVSTVDRWTLVPMCFVREALETGSLTLRSSGRQERNFVSTQEVADLIAELISSFPQGFTAVNVASDWNCSIAEIAAMVQDAWNHEKGLSLDFSILSNEPRQGNSFTVKSHFEQLRPPREESRRRMHEVITRLLSPHSSWENKSQ